MRPFQRIEPNSVNAAPRSAREVPRLEKPRRQEGLALRLEPGTL